MARRPPPWPCGCCSSSSHPRCTQAAPNPSRLHRSIKGLLFIISYKMAAASSSGVRAGFHRAEPVIIDPGHYADMFWTPQRRSVTTAFKLFTGFHMAKPVIIDPGSAWTCSGYHSAGACLQPSSSSPVISKKQHKLITTGAAVLNLGCTPDTWLQVACQNLGRHPCLELKAKIPSAHCGSPVRTVSVNVMALLKQQTQAM